MINTRYSNLKSQLNTELNQFLVKAWNHLLPYLQSECKPTCTSFLPPGQSHNSSLHPAAVKWTVGGLKSDYRLHSKTGFQQAQFEIYNI